MGKEEAAQTPQNAPVPTIVPDVATAPHPTGPLLPHAPGTSPDTTTRQDIPAQNPEAALPEAAPREQVED